MNERDFRRLLMIVDVVEQVRGYPEIRGFDCLTHQSSEDLHIALTPLGASGADCGIHQILQARSCDKSKEGFLATNFPQSLMT